MRALLFIVVLSLSACAADSFTRPSPVCTTVLEYDYIDERCFEHTHFGPVCALFPSEGTHPVTVCR